MRENFKLVLWSAGSVGLLFTLALTLLSLSGTNRHVTLAGTGQMERHTATVEPTKVVMPNTRHVEPHANWSPDFKTKTALGLAISPGVLALTNEVIE